MLLQHPHDHFVREFLGDVRYAREFLSAVLPPELSERLDWAQLRSEPTTFIDENLRDQSSDLGSPVKSSDVSRCDRQGSVIVMNEIPNSPDVIFYSF
jgi:predicted transposase YdaD